MFSVVTPSYRQLDWLRLCAASVADQEGVAVEHIVQDAGSGPELEAWAKTRPQVRLFVEKDQGMYDAVNRGLRRARGDLCAYLNCDEQYLPTALRRVEQEFAAHPEVDVILGDSIVVDGAGHYVCNRQALVPQELHSRVSRNLAVLSSGIFFRRRLLEEHGLFFDPAWKDTGDAIWILGMLQSGVRMRACDAFTSTFTDTGANMSLKPNAQAEQARLVASAPRWARVMRPLIIFQHRLRKLAHGHYWPRPLTYEIFTLASPERRVRFEVPRTTGIWRSRLRG